MLTLHLGSIGPTTVSQSEDVFRLDMTAYEDITIPYSILNPDPFLEKLVANFESLAKTKKVNLIPVPSVSDCKQKNYVTLSCP